MRNRLKHWRHRKEMDQTEFAEYLGVRPGQINQWEHHKKQQSLETLWAIYNKLKIDFPEIHLEDLLGPAED